MKLKPPPYVFRLTVFGVIIVMSYMVGVLLMDITNISELTVNLISAVSSGSFVSIVFSRMQ